MKKLVINNFVVLLLLVGFNAYAKSDICPMLDDKEAEYTIKQNPTEFEDESSEVKSLNTDFVNQVFFKTPDTFFHFLKLVNAEVSKGVEEYALANNLPSSSILMLFKGGNVLRMIAKTFLNALPLEIRTLLKEKYEPFFKRSDADFGIIIDHNQIPAEKYEETIRDLAKIVYEKLVKVVGIFNQEPEKYFNFMQYNDKTATKVFTQFFSKVNELEAFKNPDNKTWYDKKVLQVQLENISSNPDFQCQYQGNYNYSFDFENKDDMEQIKAQKLNHQSSWASTTMNFTLEWPTAIDPDDIVKFFLVRSKVQFEYLVEDADKKLSRKLVGGELIDVSLAHKKDFRLEGLLDNAENFIKEYKLTLKSSQESFSFYSESLAGLAVDLHEIVFDSFVRPWEGSKYEKRVNRLFFLALVEMATKDLGIGPDSKAYLDDFAKELDNIRNLASLDAQKVEEAQKAFLALEEKWPSMNILNDIMTSVIDLAGVMIKHPLDNDQEEYLHLFELMDENINLLKEVSSKATSPVSIPPESIYDVTMETFFYDD